MRSTWWNGDDVPGALCYVRTVLFQRVFELFLYYNINNNRTWVGAHPGLKVLGYDPLSLWDR